MAEIAPRFAGVIIRITNIGHLETNEVLNSINELETCLFEAGIIE